MSDGTTQTDDEGIPSMTEIVLTSAHRYINALEKDVKTLTAERDAARAELARLREACAGAPAMMADMLGFLRTETGWMRVSYDEYAAEIAAKATAIRAALD